jgi:predicted HTH domain antitoxin
MMNASELKVSLPPGLSEDEARLLLAIKLYETGKATLGQAARLAGFSRRAFIEVLGRYQIPVFNYSPDELREELGL